MSESEIDALLEEQPDDEIPPEPQDTLRLEDMTLAQREAFKLAAMTPEQRKRYDAATQEIMSHPAVAAFKTEEDRRYQEKKATEAAFLAAYRKKLKEKA